MSAPRGPLSHNQSSQSEVPWGGLEMQFIKSDTTINLKSDMQKAAHLSQVCVPNQTQV